MVLRDDYTGQIEQVNAALLSQLVNAGYVPVIAPLALGYEGERLNVDGDRASAAIASALHAEALVIMTNVPGLLTNVADANSRIAHIPFAHLDDYMHYAKGRMRKKLLGAREALQGGVPRVCIGNASLQDVLNGAGTIIEIGDEHSQRDLNSRGGEKGVMNYTRTSSHDWNDRKGDVPTHEIVEASCHVRV